jgi:chondroitin polymerizing factor
VRKDVDISNLNSRQYQNVSSVMDIFVNAQTSVHILRAVEPTLRFGLRMNKFIESLGEDPLPKCEFINTALDYKCINLASRKQIGEVAVVLQDYDDKKKEFI